MGISRLPSRQQFRSGDPEDREIDFNRVVWDPDYRKSVIHRLKREAADNDQTAKP